LKNLPPLAPPGSFRGGSCPMCPPKGAHGPHAPLRRLTPLIRPWHICTKTHDDEVQLGNCRHGYVTYRRHVRNHKPPPGSSSGLGRWLIKLVSFQPWHWSPLRDWPIIGNDPTSLAYVRHFCIYSSLYVYIQYKYRLYICMYTLYVYIHIYSLFHLSVYFIVLIHLLRWVYRFYSVYRFYRLYC